MISLKKYSWHHSRRTRPLSTSLRPQRNACPDGAWSTSARIPAASSAIPPWQTCTRRAPSASIAQAYGNRFYIYVRNEIVSRVSARRPRWSSKHRMRRWRCASANMVRGLIAWVAHFYNAFTKFPPFDSPRESTLIPWHHAINAKTAFRASLPHLHSMLRFTTAYVPYLPEICEPPTLCKYGWSALLTRLSNFKPEAIKLGLTSYTARRRISPDALGEDTRSHTSDGCLRNRYAGKSWHVIHLCMPPLRAFR